MTDRPRTGAKAITWDWDLLTTLYDEQIQCYQFTNRQIGFLLPILTQSAWTTRWFNRPDDFQDVLGFVNATGLALMTPVPCSTPIQPTPACPELPKGITIRDGNLIIDGRECDMQIIINNYECGCGCPDNSGQSTSFGGGSSTGTGGAGGSWTYTGSNNGGQASDYGITQCDFVTTMIPLILQSAVELIQYFDDNAENLDGLVDGLASLAGSIPLIGDIGGGAMQWITTVINAGTSATLTMLEDQDFKYKVMESWVKAHSNDGNMTTITRQDLLDTTQYLPTTWIGANAVIFPQIIMSGIYRVLSMDKITTRFILAQGTASDNLCTYIWAGAGLTFEPSAVQNDIDLPFPTESELLAQGYSWAHVFDLRDAAFVVNSSWAWQTQAGANCGTWVSGTGYVGSCDLVATPHSIMRLGFNVNHAGTAGTVQYCSCEYSYAYQVAQGYEARVICGQGQDATQDFTGVQEFTGLTINGGAISFNLLPKRCLNTGTCCGTQPTISRLAFAGIGIDPIAGLAQA